MAVDLRQTLRISIQPTIHSLDLSVRVIPLLPCPRNLLIRALMGLRRCYGNSIAFAIHSLDYSLFTRLMDLYRTPCSVA